MNSFTSEKKEKLLEDLRDPNSCSGLNCSDCPLNRDDKAPGCMMGVLIAKVRDTKVPPCPTCGK